MKLPHLAVGLTLALAVGSATANPRFQYDVEPAANGAFDITLARSGGDTAYWCAASEYAQGELNASTSDRIYTWGRTSNGAVRFALTAPSAGPVQSLSVSIDTVGNSLSVVSAYQYCLDVLIGA